MWRQITINQMLLKRTKLSDFVVWNVKSFFLPLIQCERSCEEFNSHDLRYKKKRSSSSSLLCSLTFTFIIQFKCHNSIRRCTHGHWSKFLPLIMVAADHGPMQKIQTAHMNTNCCIRFSDFALTFITRNFAVFVIIAVDTIRLMRLFNSPQSQRSSDCFELKWMPTTKAKRLHGSRWTSRRSVGMSDKISQLSRCLLVISCLGKGSDFKRLHLHLNTSFLLYHA